MFHHPLSRILVLWCLLGGLPAPAQTPVAGPDTVATPTAPVEAPHILPAEPATNSSLPALNWVPPDDSFDWIQLKSGEWLKGRFKGMQDRELEFESEELDDQSFDWKDIRQVRTHRIVDVLFVDDERVSGPVTITPTEVTVAGETPRVFPRDQLQSLTPGGTRERQLWSGKLSVGITLRSGNTEQADFSTTAYLERRTPATRLKLNYLANFSELDGTQSANNHRLNSEFDLWISRRFYLIVPYLEYYRDPFQNLDHRLTGSVGVGYDLVAARKVEWNITAGPAYQYAWYASSQSGEPTEKGAAAIVFGSRFDWDITRKLEFTVEYRGQYTSQEIGETTHHAVSTLSFEVTHRFDLDVSLTWDRIANPKVGSDGIAPKPDDFRLVVGLGLDF